MIEDIIIPLAVIAAAEFGDKTQISILLLSSQSKKHLQILFGVLLAFLIVDGVAIAAGSWITTLINIKILKIISGSVFIIFGIFMLLNRKEEEGERKYDKNAFISAFLLIFLTEWGDKTQIAAAIFATQYNALLVLIGTILALTTLSLMAIFFGKILSEKLDKKLINKVGGLIFIVMGIIFFF
jgi:putative Ca2+/H+ antiporter (TMEM165/GDT1 family)